MDNLNDHDPITVIEFCAGYGGLGLGIKGVLGERMRLIGLCELEGFAQANLISKMEAGLMEQVPIWSNLLTFPYRKFRGLVDIAAAGIPCQPHSLAGKRSGGGDQRFLFDDWLCGLEQMQPRAIFIENVEGFLSSKMPDGTLCVEWTIKRLEAMGYQTATGIFSAREVGAPHQRKRVFILAHRIDQGLQGRAFNGSRMDSTRQRTIKERHAGQGCRTTEGCQSTNSNDRGDVQSWPSRPGQPQHGWEPPRVVGDTSGVRSGEPTDGIGQAASWADASNNEDMGNAEGGMPRQSSAGDWREGAGGGEGGQLGDSNSWRQSPSIDTGSSGETISGGESNIEQTECRQAQPTLGGDADGTTRGMDYAELCVTCDNRTDELRLLGNGVVPATATLAFQTLLAELLAL